MFMNWWSYLNSDDSNKLQNISWAALQRVLTYARPYQWKMVVLLLTILLTTGLGLITPLIFRDLIDGALVPPGDPARLNLLAVGLIAIPVISGVIRVFQRRVNAQIGEGVIYDLRVAMFSHMQKMSLRFFTNTKSGELISRLNNDVVDAQRAISSTIVDIITNSLTVIATLAVMLVLEWRLTIIGVVVFPLFILVAQRIAKRVRVIIRDQQISNAQMNAMMNETLNISGALLVKLFGRATNEVERFDDRAMHVRDAGIQRAVITVQLFVLVSLISVIGTALVYWVGGHLVLTGEFTVGTIVAFGTYLTQLYTPLQALSNAPVDFATSIVSFERVFEIVDLPLEIAEKEDAIILNDVKGRLVFENVTFLYDTKNLPQLSNVQRYDESSVEAALTGESPERKENGTHHQARDIALSNISYEIEPGHLVALVGPSGAGKTTMTYLIPRLYDPSKGRITLDGHDLRDLTLDSLAQNIGMVTQETYLFHDTIRANLLYAKLDATQEEVETACRAANIHDFIAGLPDGYDTIVGERGYRLSGGEKQRIAIARVILKDPRIIVLDEATSHLDSQSEALIQDALAKVQEGRTSIVIAHRLSTILAADQIFVMDRGSIVERGTHDELLVRGGLYASLYETQFSVEQQPAL